MNEHASFVEKPNIEASSSEIAKRVEGVMKAMSEAKDSQDRLIESGIVPEYMGSYFVVPVDEISDMVYREVKGRKVYAMCTENIYKVLSYNGTVIGKFRYDDFRNVIEVNRMDTIRDGASGRWQAIEDIDEIIVQTKVSKYFPDFQKVSKAMVQDAIAKMAHTNHYDSAIDRLKSLAWDQVPRIDTWLSNAYGCPVDAYHTGVGSNWLKGLVNRLAVPGCKFDYVLVLEGPQGCRKSESFHALVGDWHVETTMSTDSKDFFMQFNGKAVVEFSEGETLSRTEVKKMKAIITTKVDTFRPPYGRVSKDFPRRCVFAMTTNQKQYLKDETGERRWLPVEVTLPKADTDWILANRDQLLAEAYHRVVTLRESYWEMPEEETLAEQMKRRLADPNEELVEEWYSKLDEGRKSDGISSHDAWVGVYHNDYAPSKPMARYEEQAIANTLKVMGLIRRQTMRNGIRKWKWYDPKTDAMNQVIEKSVVRSGEEEEMAKAVEKALMQTGRY